MLRLPFRSAPSNRISLGDRARDAGQWALAAEYYREALDQNPDNAPIWVQYGHALKEQGRLQASEQAYRRSLSLDNGVADTHLQLGHALKLQGRTFEAEQAYVHAFQLDPSSPYAVNELQTFYPKFPDASKSDQFKIDPRFVEEIYGDADKDTYTSTHDIFAPGMARYVRFRNCEHLLAWHWLSNDVLDIFDCLYYFHSNPSVFRDLKSANYYRCLFHFCKVGIGQLLPCNDDLSFDPSFYIETYFSDKSFSDQAAYREWLNAGHRAGQHPNKQRWIKSILNIDEAQLGNIDIELYFDQSHKKNQNWAELFLRFVDEDARQASRYFPISAEATDIFVSIADRFAKAGKDIDAINIYECVLYSVPSHQQALRHHADCLIRQGSVWEALRIHEALAKNGNDVLSFSTLAWCYERLGDFRKSLTVLREAMDVDPGDITLRRRFETLADRFIVREWQLRAFPLGMLGKFDEARDYLASAGELVSKLSSKERRLPRRSVQSVAIVTVQISRQCRFYRVEQKVEQLCSAGFEVTVYEEGEIDRYLSEAYLFDAVIFYRLPGLARLLFAINKSKELGISTYYEVDDLVFTTDFPDSLESYRGLVEMEEYVGLKLGVPLYRNAIALCDYGIASTTPLAIELSKIVSSGKAFVHRNAFGHVHQFLSAEEPWSPDKGEIVIFYGSGTKAHKEDFQKLVQPALIELVRRHGRRVTIILAGYIVIDTQLETIRSNLQVVDINWDVEEYWALLKSADINIAVLKPSLMSDCKSEIKWMEAAMFGIPSVVSGSSTYREVVEQGVTGIICDTVDEWTAALDLLIRDPLLRKRMGYEAWSRVRQTYSVAAAASNLSQILKIDGAEAGQLPKPVVVIVNVFYPPQAIGGATRVVHDNVRYLSTAYDKDFQIEVFTSTFGGERGHEISSYVQDGVRVTAIDLPSSAEVESAVVDERVGEVFGNFLDRVRPSIVHFHCIQRLTTSVVSVTRARSIPYLITAHDAWWISSHHFGVNERDDLELYDYSSPLRVISNLGKAAYDRMMQLQQILFSADRVLAVSDRFADIYKKCGVLNVLVVENGVSQLPAPERSASTDGRVRLAFVGSMAAIKGYKIIKYAFLGKKFNHLRLKIMDPSLRSGQCRTESWNGTPVEFFAKIPEARVGELYEQTDVLLAPSIWPESFGLVTREALHFGCWVIASDRGSVGACVNENVNGHLIDVSDASDLIRVLTLIDTNPERYLASPPGPIEFRKATEQSEELADIYKSLIAPNTKF